MKGVIYFTKIRDEYAGKNMEHMIGENLTEAQLGLVGRLGLEGRGFRDLDIQHFKNSPLLLV